MNRPEYMEPVIADLAFEIFAEAVGVDAVRNVLSQDTIAKDAGWNEGVTVEEAQFNGGQIESWWSITTDNDNLTFVIGSFRMAVPLIRAEQILETLDHSTINLNRNLKGDD